MCSKNLSWLLRIVVGRRCALATINTISLGVGVLSGCNTPNFQRLFYHLLMFNIIPLKIIL